MWYEWILYILLMIIMLGVLVSIHEAGHLTMAKIFKVYCFEYSIGFGPALLKKKRKKGETYFSIRAVPFGGYVSMYGEAGAVPEGMEEPPAERSIEAIAKWKKCFILLAGVTMNFILGLVLIYLSNSVCPRFYTGTRAAVTPEGTTTLLKIESTFDDKTIEFISTNPAFDPSLGFGSYEVVFPITEKDGYTVLDAEVTIEHKNAEGQYIPEPDKYVALYGPPTVIADHNLNDSIRLFPIDKKNAPTERDLSYGITNLPYAFDANGNSQEIVVSKLSPGTRFEIKAPICPYTKAGTAEEVSAANENFFKNKLIRGSGPLFTFTVDDNNVLSKSGIEVNTCQHWNTFGESWQRWAEDVPNACSAIVKGFASLFTPGGFKNLSGVVGITAALPQINAAGGARMILYFAGMLSINLAFFNLLPFPALDGYAFVVTVIEGITKKKVPSKVANILSIIGFVLLFGLMIAVTIKDVIGLF